MVEIIYGDATELKNTTIWVGLTPIYAARVAILTYSLKPLRHATEEGIEVWDHVREEPISIKITLRLCEIWQSSDKMLHTRQWLLERIKGWIEWKTPQTIITDMGSFNNMIITKAEITEDSSSDSSYIGELEFGESIMAYLTPTEELWYIDTDGQLYDEGGKIEGATVEGTLSEPEKLGQKDQGWQLGHNIAEIGQWIWSKGEDDVEWKWPL